jgi:N-acetylmuramoyl-L-alanine amidase CwlD
LNSINRWRVRTSKSLALSLILSAFAGFSNPQAAVAQPNGGFWFAGSTLIFAKAQSRGGEVAVALDDPGLGKFLAKLGASINYPPGQRYIVVASGDRRAITFTIGDSHFSDGEVRGEAPFAPYQAGSSVYVPFLTLAKLLSVVPVNDNGVTVLQPQISSLDIHIRDRVTTVTLRGAVPLRFKRTSPAQSERVVLSFAGVASTLDTERAIRGSAEMRGVTINVTGSPRNPTTAVTFDASAGTLHALAAVESPNVLSIGFAKAGIALAGSAIPETGPASVVATGPSRATSIQVRRALPQPVPTVDPNSVHNENYASPGATVPSDNAAPPPPIAPAATVTSIDLTPGDQTLAVHVGVSGAVRYEWHRLGDDRWYIDIKDAMLGVPGRDEQPQTSAVSSVRIRQFNDDPNPTVRIALDLTSPRQVNVAAASGGLTVTVGAADDQQPQRVGAGSFSGGTIVAAAPLAGTNDIWSTPPQPTPHPSVPTNPKLIVIDPGHGGSDFGAVHNGLDEKNVTLDISRRLRTLLIARGWQVKMTRDSDVDVASPNASAHDELQARCDVANDAGARLFVSVHVNSFPTAEQNGTTTYYYKDSDQALANAVRKRLETIGTADKGVRKEEFYVIHHTTMPATLIETAFLSNLSDAALLRSPDFLRKVALAIADGIGDYAANNPVNTTSGGS